jgi:demethylmenaquinone methyltransferase/2-methoxy-6-polyprenyl-1,4-benzoquinol methylase
MTNKYYEAGLQRASKVNDLFAVVAPRYDLINDLQSFGWHRCWKRRLVSLAAAAPHQQALDLCCGTGDVTLALARHGASVVGLDFSEPMLAVAERRFKIQSSKLKVDGRMPMVRWLRGDALAIPFGDGGFDIVTISYGLRNLSDWRAGLDEMWRVARPAGRLLVLDFGKPANALWRRIYFAYLRWFVPWFGKAFCGDAPAYAYILESLQQYPAQVGVASYLREMGGQDVRVLNLLGGVMSILYARKPTGRG